MLSSTVYLLLLLKNVWRNERQHAALIAATIKHYSTFSTPALVFFLKGVTPGSTIHLVLALHSVYSSAGPSPQIFADLPGHLPPGGLSTLLSDILPASQRPDLVLIFPNKYSFVELTVNNESNLDAASSQKKHDRYASLISALRRASYFVRFFSLNFEVGSNDFLSDFHFSVLFAILLSDKKFLLNNSTIWSLPSLCFLLLHNFAFPVWTLLDKSFQSNNPSPSPIDVPLVFDKAH